LRRHRRIALDTSVFIYQLEANVKYVGLTDPIFTWLGQPNHTGITSTITMTELLVPAYRSAGEALADQFYGLLTTYPNLEWVAPNLEVADTAARIRAQHRLRTPDALQVTTAIRSHATGLVTNESTFERVEAFETIVLDGLL
jgi:predicted nucleic acid-binding protein